MALKNHSLSRSAGSFAALVLGLASASPVSAQSKWTGGTGIVWADPTTTRVGIGINPPASGVALHVAGNAAAGTRVSIQNSITSGIHWQLVSGGGTDVPLNNFALRNATSSANWLLVSSSGAVTMPGSLGVTGNTTVGALTASGLLTANNRAAINGNLANQEALVVTQNQTGGSIADFRRGTASHMRIDNAGNVIIGNGTSSPSQKLDVNGSAAIRGSMGIGTTSLSAILNVNGGSVGAGNNGIDIENPVGVGSKFKLSAGIKGYDEGGFSILDRKAGDAHRFTIKPNGYVGINNHSPEHQLDLYGSMRIYGANANDFTALVLRAGSNGGDKTRIKFVGDNNGDYAEIVGISTMPGTGNGTPYGGALVFRTRNGTQSTDMRDQLTIMEDGRFILGTGGANLGMYTIRPTDGSSGSNNANGSALMVRAGSCDNQAGKHGGTLYLRGGGQNQNLGNIGNVAIADDGGSVGIGTDNPGAGFKVDVRGNVNIAGDVTVAGVKTRVWSVVPDYVFEKGYDLKPLHEVEKFLERNKHLPEIPSAKEIGEKGIDLAEMNMKLLKKVEELTLHAIRQEKELRRQSDAMRSQASLIEKLEQRLR